MYIVAFRADSAWEFQAAFAFLSDAIVWAGMYLGGMSHAIVSFEHGSVVHEVKIHRNGHDRDEDDHYRGL